jgi:hypothetical protein
VQHQSIKTRDFAEETGSQATLTSAAIPCAHGGDLPSGVIGG